MDLIIQHIAQLFSLADPSQPSPRGEGKARVGSQMSDLGSIKDGLLTKERFLKN
jgi:hypothetical protein